MTALTYGSVCSGIEAASVAWHKLGWVPKWLAEIEDFPSRVLAHRFPHVPNLGDMTKIAASVRAGLVDAPDVLVGGTPCQAFSFAGLRKSLDDARGQLSLAFVDLANAIDSIRSVRGERPAIVVWENVPGCLSTHDNAFGCFLGALAGEDDPIGAPVDARGRAQRWPDAGVLYGPQRAVAWRVLDAQYFGVAQRRRRVFVCAVGYSDQGIDPARILFEFEGERRDIAPSRKAWQDVTGTLSSRTTGGGGLGTDFECIGGLQPVTGSLMPVTVMAHGQGGAEISVERCPTLTCNHEAPIAAYGVQPALFAENGHLSYAGDRNPTLRAAGGDTGGGGEALVVQPDAYAFQPRIACNGRGDMGEVVNALTAQAGETGKGDAAPCVAYGIPGNWIGRKPENGGNATEPMVDIAPCLTKMDRHAVAEIQPDAIAYRVGGDGDVWPMGDQTAPLTTGTDRTANVALCFKPSHFTRDKDGAPSEVFPPLTREADKGDQEALAYGYRMAVRRFMPVECERLQGFPDDWTRIPVKHFQRRIITKNRPAHYWDKVEGGWMLMAPDGPRYKALGNSMAVPCMHWIGSRIQNEYNRTALLLAA